MSSTERNTKMTETLNDGAGQRRKRLLAIAAVLLLTGCVADDSADAPFTHNSLPEVTEYVSAAESLRSETSVSESAQTENTVSEVTEQSDSADSETVSEGDAASYQSESETEISAPAETTAAPTETIASEQTSAVSETAAVTTTAVSTEIVTECSVPMAENESETAAPAVSETSAAVTASNKYDSEFFENDLFIGDSISTGYSLYGFLPEKNVFAKVGLNPSTVLTRTVSTCYGDIGVSDMLVNTSPERVYIMLGSNGIQWLSVANMIKSTDTLKNLIEETCPGAEFIIISVPPVTPEYDATVADVDVMSKINEYNSSLSSYCRANGLLFVDAASLLKNENGYFDYSYAESDGMHFKSSAYKTLLSKIQSDVTDFEEYKAEKYAAETSVTVTETEAEEDAVTADTTDSEAAASETEITNAEKQDKLSVGA